MYSEEQVKELLKKQRELCAQSVLFKPTEPEIILDAIKNAPEPELAAPQALEGWKEALEKEADKYASFNFPNKSSFEFHTQYSSFIRGAEWASAQQAPVTPQLEGWEKKMEKEAEKYCFKGVWSISHHPHINVDDATYTHFRNGFKSAIENIKVKRR